MSGDDGVISGENGQTYVFFFQAEDGIRDGRVTGVQTCALPIFPTSNVAALTPGVRSAMDYFKAEALAFAHCCTDLRHSIESMTAGDAKSVARVRQKLIDCRLHYKKIES